MDSTEKTFFAQSYQQARAAFLAACEAAHLPVQNALLHNTALLQAARQSGVALLFIHALNPCLGPSGQGERIYAYRPDDAALARARRVWGAEATSIDDGSSASTVLTGLMWQAVAGLA